LKLHGDADPQKGVMAGRLEHLASGRQHHFKTVEQLVACLIQGAAPIHAPGSAETET